jgi:hypothetical protein
MSVTRRVIHNDIATENRVVGLPKLLPGPSDPAQRGQTSDRQVPTLWGSDNPGLVATVSGQWTCAHADVWRPGSYGNPRSDATAPCRVNICISGPRH